jgi:hypothetical protein
MDTFTRDDDDRARPGAGDRRSWTGGQGREAPGSGGARAGRRRFTARYKLDVLAAYDAAAQGEKGAILRRGGPLFQSHHRLAAGPGRRVRWRAWTGPAGGRQRIRGTRRSAAMQKENQQLGQELARARFVVEVQAKLQALLA